MCSFLFFVGMGCAEFYPSHLLVVEQFGFLVLAAFLFALGWVEWNLIPWVNMVQCWMGWDEDGKVCWELDCCGM